jgi:hypothetical protein
MGYYTLYELETLHTQPDEAQLASDFKEITGYEIGALDNGSLKWYESEANMIELSKRYPSTIFRLHGDGEESDDFWLMYYCNGQSAGGQAELAYPDVDIKALGGIGERHPEYFI